MKAIYRIAVELEVIQRIKQLAAKLSVKSGKVVTIQEVTKRALTEYLDKNES